MKQICKFGFIDHANKLTAAIFSNLNRNQPPRCHWVARFSREKAAPWLATRALKSTTETRITQTFTRQWYMAVDRGDQCKDANAYRGLWNIHLSLRCFEATLEELLYLLNRHDVRTIEDDRQFVRSFVADYVFVEDFVKRLARGDSRDDQLVAHCGGSGWQGGGVWPRDVVVTCFPTITTLTAWR